MNDEARRLLLQVERRYAALDRGQRQAVRNKDERLYNRISAEKLAILAGLRVLTGEVVPPPVARADA